MIIPQGPMERALDRAVVESLGLDGPLPEGAEPEWVRRHELGDVRVDLRPLLGVEWPDPEVVEDMLVALRARPEIDDATFVPPRIFLKVGLDHFDALVLGADDGAPPDLGMEPDGSPGTASVTFSDPNVNKPLHVGHLRNAVMGIAVARLLEHEGWAVRRSELCSDWGLHICRAVVGYQRWGEGATPESAGLPGDVLVGQSYVRFHRESMKQIRGARSALPGPLLEDAAADLLRRLESGDDPEAEALQNRLTGWVEAGIDEIYERIGCGFEGRFRESANRAVGRGLVERGLASGACRRRADGSVYIDLNDGGHNDYGELTLMRPDGTDLVYTRAFGAVMERRHAHPSDRVIDVLGADWESAYPAFLEALARLGEEWARDVELVFHGMVHIGSGKMKSRDGLVVSARDMLDGATAGFASRWRLPGGADDSIAAALGVGLVKFHLLATQRTKDVTFDEKQLWKGGYSRFATVLRMLVTVDQARAEGSGTGAPQPGPAGDEAEAETWRKLLHALNGFPRVVGYATRDLDPSLLVRYLDDLCLAIDVARRSHQLGRAWPVIDAVLTRSLWLLGIDLPPVAQWRPTPTPEASRPTQDRTPSFAPTGGAS